MHSYRRAGAAGRPTLYLALLAGLIAGGAFAQGSCPPGDVDLIRSPCTGCVPLDDLGPGFYQGFQGGLYPGGANVPPPAHHAAAVALAQQIEPLDRQGDPDPDGLIGLIAVSMSNGSQEFAVFERREDLNGARNPQVVITDTAQGGKSADVIKDPNDNYWTLVRDRLQAAGVSPLQVQAAWIKGADDMPCCNNVFPDHAINLRDELRQIVQILKNRFPNLRLAFLSSRIYGGYSARAERSEPLSYETGFAAKWLIEDQINGDPSLNYDPDDALPDRAPLLLWGPYLWADGPSPSLQGRLWCRGDLEDDAVHPGPGAEAKVGNLLSAFFAADDATLPWFAAPGGTQLVALDATDDAFVDADSGDANFGDSPLLWVTPPTDPWLAGERDVYLRFDASGVSGTLLHAKLSLRVHTANAGGGDVFRAASHAWSEDVITWNNAPGIDAAHLLAPVPPVSRDNTFSARVTPAVDAALGGPIAFAVTTAQGTGVRLMRSKEDAEPPRLILTLRQP